MLKAHDSAVLGHVDVLRRFVFQTESKWPQFNLLLDDLLDVSANLGACDRVLVLERTLLYGGYSLTAPIFRHCHCVSADCSPLSADDRGSYNKDLIEHPEFLRMKHNVRINANEVSLSEGGFDCVIVPNVVHHLADTTVFFKDVHSLLRPGGFIYIFESVLREIHQAPDDFVRFTPYGLEKALTDASFTAFRHREAGGVFDAISYCWIQALEYMSGQKKEQMEKWFWGEHFAELQQLDKEFKVNLERPLSRFPTGFSVVAYKP